MENGTLAFRAAARRSSVSFGSSSMCSTITGGHLLARAGRALSVMLATGLLRVFFIVKGQNHILPGTGPACVKTLPSHRLYPTIRNRLASQKNLSAFFHRHRRLPQKQEEFEPVPPPFGPYVEP